MFVHVRYNSWYISLLSSAKNDQISSVPSEELGPQRLSLLKNSILKLTMCSIFSFEIVLTVINKINGLRVSGDS